jgi:transcriptional regulator with XRE-family HTH domain
LFNGRPAIKEASPSYAPPPSRETRARSGSEGATVRVGTCGCRRPLQPEETPYLIAVANRLREVRRSRGLTQAELAVAAELSRRHVERLEAGNRRTRRSTLSRIAEALGDPSLEDELVGLAGPALAPESEYAERVVRRRQRRLRRQALARERESQARTQEALETPEKPARFTRPLTTYWDHAV